MRCHTSDHYLLLFLKYFKYQISKSNISHIKYFKYQISKYREFLILETRYMRCHTSDHYLATSVPPRGRSSVFPCQVIIVLVLSSFASPSFSVFACAQCILHRGWGHVSISKTFLLFQTLQQTIGIISIPFITSFADIGYHVHNVHFL